jgi:transposase
MEIGSLLSGLVNFMVCREIQLENGEIWVQSSAKEHQAVSVVFFYVRLVSAMTNLEILLPATTLRTLCMLEFHQANKNKILSDRLSFYLTSTQIIPLLKTLAQDSIINGEVFSNCWNRVVKERSEKLWYPAGTECQGSASIWSSGSLHRTGQNSWFSIAKTRPQSKNLLKIFYPFCKFLLADTLENENTPLIRTRKIRLKPNSIQKKKLKEFAGMYRFAYNKALSLLDSDGYNQKVPQEFTYEHIKKRYENKKGYKEKECKRVTRSSCYSAYDVRNLICSKVANCRTPWMEDIPYALKEGAAFEAHANLMINQKKVNSGTIKFFNMKYKSKKDKGWCLKNIRKEGVSVFDKQIAVLPETLGRIKTTEQVPEIQKTVSIHFNGREFFLCVPIHIQAKAVNQDNWFCALDPGVRKFQTLYSPDTDEVINVGDRASANIFKLLLSLDKTKDPCKEHKLRQKVKYLQKELHDKTALFLCQNYKNIYIPKLTKNNDIIKKKNRRIGKKTVRQMVLLGHCKFVERLKTKADEYNVNVSIVTEEYTSQVCYRCGLKTKIKNEIFKCKHCQAKMDRDVLGSRNILLKQWGLMGTSIPMAR